MGVKHAYQSATPDNPDKEISSSEWNADHTVDDGSLTIAKTSGLQAALDGKQAQFGFPLHTDGTPAATLTYSSVDRKFTVTAKTGATFDLFVNGAKITTASPYVSTAHDATVGLWFLYHDGANFVWSSAPWDLMLHAPIGLAYWDGTSGVGYRETHTVSRDPALHRRLHEVEGTALISGGVLADWLADTDTDAGCTYSISQAVITDEDLQSTVAAVADGGPYTLWYRSGASGTWTFQTGLSFPFTFGTYPQYNKNTAGTWSLADVTANNFAVFYVLATPAVTSGHGFIIVPGQQDFTSRALADADSFAALTTGTFPFVEFCVIAKVVMEAKASYANTYNAVIKAITRLTASRSLSQSTAATQHNTLNGLQGGAPGSGEYYHLTLAEQAALHAAVTVSDSTSIDLTLTGQQISAAAIFGTTSGTVCQGNDGRLSDARTPTAHDHSGNKLAQANTHESADTDSATTALHHTLGTGANQAAAGDHTHAGYQPADTQLTDLAALSYAGNASKYIRVNATANGFELAEVVGGSGLTHQQVLARGLGA